MTVQDVLAAASQLSPEERLQVAIGLLESLRVSQYMPPKNVDTESDWKAELPPLVRSLVGVVPSDDQDFQAAYINNLGKKCSLYDLLSQSPFSRLDFEAESITSPVRAVEL